MKRVKTTLKKRKKSDSRVLFFKKFHPFWPEGTVNSVVFKKGSKKWVILSLHFTLKVRKKLNKTPIEIWAKNRKVKLEKLGSFENRRLYGGYFGKAKRLD